MLKLRAERMRKEGYEFEYNRYGYRVTHNGEFVHGAGVKGKPKMHWQHARQNVTDNFEHCIRTAENHFNAS